MSLPPTIRGNPANVIYGPGAIYVAPLATAEPTTMTAAWPSGWVLAGYTEAGHQVSHNVTRTDLMAAEEVDPVAAGVMTGRITEVAFALAEYTALNVQRALNGGTITNSVGGGPGEVYFEPPAGPGSETRTMLGWDAEDGSSRAVWRRVLQTGNVQTTFNKGVKGLIPVTFRLEKPSGGVLPWRRYFNSARAA